MHLSLFAPLTAIVSLTHIKKSQLILAAFYSVMNKVCDIIPELMIGFAVDIVISQSYSIVARVAGIINLKDQLLFVASITGLFWLFESIFEYLHMMAWSNIAIKIQHVLHCQIYQKIQTTDISFIDQKKSGDLLSMMQEDSFNASQFFEKGINAIIQLLVNIILIGLIFFVISPLIAFMSLIPIPFVIGFFILFKQKISRLYEIMRVKISSFTHQINRRIAGLITIQSYVTEEYEEQNIRRFSEEAGLATLEAYRINALYIPSLRVPVLTGFLITLVLGGLQTSYGLIEISSYATLIFLSQRFLWPFATLLAIIDQYEKTIVSIKRIFDFLSHVTTILNGAQTASKIIEKSTICFDHVSFSYKQSENRVIDNISFCIPPKNMVVFVGKTGSGKSTIMKLLLRFYDIAEGKITLDGKDIREYTLSSLRSCISLVSQEPYLIDGTIKDNIKYGSFSSSDYEIHEAAKKAILDDFVLSLPGQYDTTLTEAGKNLSGGQKQRIAIARAILRGAPIILFDEATSALDNKTESDFQRSIQTLRKQNTIIIIAHRLSMVMDADTIYVLDQGQIVEKGTHQTLLAKNGFYSDLWNAQKQ